MSNNPKRLTIEEKSNMINEMYQFIDRDRSNKESNDEELSDDIRKRKLKESKMAIIY